MDTLRTITSDIQGIANRLGAKPRNGKIDDREIELWVRQYREKWIIDTFNKNRGLYYSSKPSLIQDLGCLVLSCVDQSECLGLPTGCYVSKCIIPAPVELPGGIDYVGVINKRQRFVEVSNPNELAGRLAAPYSDKFVFYYRIGANALYIATADAEMYRDLCYVNVREVVADPTQACYKKSLTTSLCCFDKTNDPYPMTGEMASDIKMMILTREMNIAMQHLRDDSNNTRDDRQAQPQQIAR